MGNSSACMPRREGKDIRSGGGGGVTGGGGRRRVMSQRKMGLEEEMVHRQALAMAIQQHSQRFENLNNNGSMSRRILGSNGKQNNLPGVSSSRRRNLSESFSNDKWVTDILDRLETKKIVLIHGEGFGAWCWYKLIALLEESGLLPVALDLTGAGIDHSDPNNIATLAEYTKPLLDYLSNLAEDEKVILVGHSSGGACISYALESFPKKVSKAVFLSAAMVSHGQKPFDIFVEELAFAEIFKQDSKLLMYGNGMDNPPTSLRLEKSHLKELFFNQTPAKDIALAAVSMKPIPLRPMMESVSLTPENYGSVRRFFIQTLDDHMLSPEIQERLVRENPPETVFKIKGSDHCPFFSKPQSLHKLLLEISQL